MTEQKQYTKQPLITVNGTVSRAPVVKETPKGQLVAFGLAVTTGYDETDGPRWIDVSVWNAGLARFVYGNIYKGAKVAVEGFQAFREYNGKTYEQLAAQKVGLVEWGPRSQRGEVVPPIETAPAASGADTEW